jgi:hypothetical protein
MRACQVCGKHFDPVTWNNKYCSISCAELRKFIGPVKRMVKYHRVEFKTFIEESQIKKR